MGAILLKAGSFILIIIAGYLFKKTGLFHEFGFRHRSAVLPKLLPVLMPFWQCLSLGVHLSSVQI